MPHECTNCGLTFPDGSKKMLSGCPDCGGNKFQFHPDGDSADGKRSPLSTDSNTTGSSPGPSPTRGEDSPPPEERPGGPGPENTSPESSDSSFTIGSLRSEDADSEAPPEDSKVSPPDKESPGHPAPTEDDSQQNPEDNAQASARSTVASGDELPQSDHARTPRSDPSDPDPSQPQPGEPHGALSMDSNDAGAPSTDSDDADPPDISKLREELNEQFESIKIHAPGEYELNLMELYDREEHIIALQEDGRYVIDVPSSWRDTDEDD